MPDTTTDHLTVYQNRLRHHQVSRSTIEHEAQDAARRGLSLLDSCPYPFDSEAGQHFKAAWKAAQGAGTAPTPAPAPAP